jgi:hypothetical protein
MNDPVFFNQTPALFASLNVGPTSFQLSGDRLVPQAQLLDLGYAEVSVIQLSSIN